MKKHTWVHLAQPRLTVAPPGRLWRYPPAQKHTKINRKHVSEHENLLKNDNVRKRSLGNRNQKIDDSCVLTAGQETRDQKIGDSGVLTAGQENCYQKIDVSCVLTAAFTEASCC